MFCSPELSYKMSLFVEENMTRLSRDAPHPAYQFYQFSQTAKDFFRRKAILKLGMVG